MQKNPLKFLRKYYYILRSAFRRGLLPGFNLIACILIRELYSKYLTTLKGYKRMDMESNIGHDRFIVFIKNRGGKKEVIKLLRYESDGGYQLYIKLKDSKEVKRYSDILSSLNKLPFLNNHICELIRIIGYRCGEYISKYIEGYNLFYIKEGLYNLDLNTKLEIQNAITEFLGSFDKYNKKYGHPPGDWYLSNLVYSIEDKKIINVDLEGFYTYRDYYDFNNFEIIKRQLGEIVQLIR